MTYRIIFNAEGSLLNASMLSRELGSFKVKLSSHATRGLRGATCLCYDQTTGKGISISGSIYKSDQEVP